jgi:hypothetical protein
MVLVRLRTLRQQRRSKKSQTPPELSISPDPDLTIALYYVQKITSILSKPILLHFLSGEDQGGS